MLRISQKQLSEFDRRIGEAYLRRLRDFLREHFAEGLAAWSDDKIERFAINVIERAESFGIDDGAAIAQLACLTIATGGRLFDLPEVREFLSDDSLADRDRVQALVDELADLDESRSTVGGM